MRQYRPSTHLCRKKGQKNAVLAFTQNSRSEVRRFTLVEFERLQGMNDDHTLIP